MTKTYKEKEENVICKICGKECLYLGSHLWHGHKIRAREYKSMFGLDYNLPLMCEEVQEKKRKAFDKNREKYLKNLSGSEKFRFKKGVHKRKYFSSQSIYRYKEQLKKIDNSGRCFICGMVFKGLYIHLYEKHGLKKEKQNGNNKRC